MKIAVHLARNRRLLAWCAVSLALHLLVVAWLDTPANGPVKRIMTSPLSVRLEGRPAAGRPPRQAAANGVPVEAPVVVPAATAKPVQHTTRAAPPLPSSAARAPRPTRPSAAVLAPVEPEGSPSDQSHEAAGAPNLPGAYEVWQPPSTHLSYAVTRTRPGAPEETLPPAQLVWKRENHRYELHMDGVLGELESEGGEDDDGIAPEVAREPSPTGGRYTTRFYRDKPRIDYPGGSVELLQGAQDPASVLMQLAGIGIAQPRQIGKTVVILVGSAAGARIVRYDVLGREELETAVGRLATVRLAQQTKAGERRIEIWLAVDYNWMPVQLRVTDPDGSYATQVVTSIETTVVPRPQG